MFFITALKFKILACIWATISRKQNLSLGDNLHEMSNLFSGEDKTNISPCCPLKILPGMLSIKNWFIMFQDSLIANLLRLIQKMKPKPKVKEKENIIAGQQSDIEIKKKLFPGLALPNDPSVRLMSTPVSTNAQVHTNTHLGAQIHTYSCTHRHTCFSSFLMNHVIMWLK